MATIERRGERWRVQIRKAGYPAVNRTFSRKADAIAFARETEISMERGAYLAGRGADTMTVRDACLRYIDKEARRERGSKQKINRLKQLSRQPWSRYALTKLPAVVLVDWRDERLETVTARTVTNDLNALSKVYKIARTEWGFRGLYNPLTDVRRPVGGQPRDRRLAAGEYERLRDAPVTVCPNWSSVFVFAVETAMRRGEIASLSWTQVDLANRVARLDLTKNGDSRDVPLSSLACSAVRAAVPSLHAGLFSASASTISHGFRQARAYAEAEDLRFHDLRREAASRMLEKGLSIHEVAKIGGWKTLKILLTTYTRLNAKTLAEKLG